MKPLIHIHDSLTGESTIREMTEEEYAELLASGWTPDPDPEE